jgi:hydroxyethylthiazole kinase-like uncharacterized protein yjeF
MMLSAFTADQIRRAEQPLLARGVPLMARAAHGLALHALEHLRRLRPAGRVRGAAVLILAGGGNNGGDALFAGAELRAHGVRVDALAVGSHLHEDGASALHRAGGHIHHLHEDPGVDPSSGAPVGPGARDVSARLAGAVPGPPVGHGTDLVLDAVLGTGGRPELRDDLRAVNDAVRELGVPVIAVDVPSGIDASTGEVADGVLHATTTVTFGALKTGLLLPGGADVAGDVRLVRIGLETTVPEHPALRRLTDQDVRTSWPRPERASHKYSRGVVQVLAGSDAFPGAAVLACSGAARAGAGMVRVDGSTRVVDHVLHHRPEVVGGPGRHQALVVGPGTSPDDPRLPEALATLHAGPEPRPGVIDAGALGAIRAGDRFHPDVVLTPHAGEAARLVDALGLDPSGRSCDRARALADATGATVLLKGAVTIVAAPDGALTSQDDATPQLATAGAGDVLAGVVGTLLAAGLPGPDAAALGALIHGRAARRASTDGAGPIVALDVAECLPSALTAILTAAVPTGSRSPEPGVGTSTRAHGGGV